jgi:hypothetical protein
MGKMLARGHIARVSETAWRDRIDSLVTLPMRVSIADAAHRPRVSVYESRFLAGGRLMAWWDRPGDGSGDQPAKPRERTSAGMPSVYRNRFRDAPEDQDDGVDGQLLAEQDPVSRRWVWRSTFKHSGGVRSIAGHRGDAE